MRPFVTVLILMMAVSSPLKSQNPQSKSLEPLLGYCFDLPSRSVTVHTPTRDSSPAIMLLLTDPLGRTAGESSSGRRIPDSSYGAINQIPNRPNVHSRALAVEVCNAKEGIYEIRVDEKSSERYALEISAESPAAGNGVSLLLHHIARKDRTRTYHFVFRVENHILVLRWIDSHGHEIPDSQLMEKGDW